MTNTDNIARFAREQAEHIASSFNNGNLSWCADQIAQMGPSLAALVILELWNLQALNAGDRKVLHMLLCECAEAAGMAIMPDSMLET